MRRAWGPLLAAAVVVTSASGCPPRGVEPRTPGAPESCPGALAVPPGASAQDRWRSQTRPRTGAVPDDPVALPAPGKVAHGPSVLLVTVDTWRADRLGLYGSPRPTSPGLERLAARGTVFDAAIAPAPWTWPTMVSLSTGLLPDEHGVLSASDVACEPLQTVAEQLRAAGYRTGLVAANQYLESAASGFHQGFEYVAATSDAHAAAVVDSAAWFLAGVGDEPFFLHVHFFDPHCPHDPPAAGLARMAAIPAPAPTAPGVRTLRSIVDGGAGGCSWLAPGGGPLEAGADGAPSGDPVDYLAAYDAELAEVDAALARLVDLARCVEPDLFTAITGDHGEEFGEHGGLGHGASAFQETTRVPLVLLPPRPPRVRRVGGATSLVHVPATLLAAAGLPPVGAGTSLLPTLDGAAPPSTALSVAESGQVAWYDADHHVVVDPGGARWLFGPHDRQDLRDLASERPDLLDSLSGAATRARRELDARRVCRTTRALSPETYDRLRVLGYVE